MGGELRLLLRKVVDDIRIAAKRDVKCIAIVLTVLLLRRGESPLTAGKDSHVLGILAVTLFGPLTLLRIVWVKGGGARHGLHIVGLDKK